MGQDKLETFAQKGHRYPQLPLNMQHAYNQDTTLKPSRIAHAEQ